MAEAASNLNFSKSSIEYAKSTVKGRIQAIRTYQTQEGMRYETLLVMPAVDEFSSPQTIAIRSNSRFSQRESIVEVEVTIGGYRRIYQTTDRETGEQSNVLTSVIYLDYVSHKEI